MELSNIYNGTLRNEKKTQLPPKNYVNPLNGLIYERLLRRKSTTVKDNAYDSSTNSDSDSESKRRRHLRRVSLNIQNNSKPLLNQKTKLIRHVHEEQMCVNGTTKSSTQQTENNADKKVSRSGSTRRKQWLSSERSSSKSQSSIDGASDSQKCSSRRNTLNKAFDQLEADKLILIDTSIIPNGNKDTQIITNSTLDKPENSTNTMSVSLDLGQSISVHIVPSPIMTQRKVSQSQKSFDPNESLPDLTEIKKANNSLDRLKRDYHLSNVEITALREILKKADLYDSLVRERMHEVLKVENSNTECINDIAERVIIEKEIVSLKEKLFASRKELDSYISFTKKMEREKRQSMSEKEELETKIQWHERRLLRFEGENKALKTERAELLNQIYELRGKSLKIKDLGRAKLLENNLLSQTESGNLKSSLIYDAESLAQERIKFSLERQRLDEENQKMLTKCTTLSAQLQHLERVVEDLKEEKDVLKIKNEKLSKQILEEQKSFQELFEFDYHSARGKLENTVMSDLIDAMKSEKAHEETRAELLQLEKKFEKLQNDHRATLEVNILKEHENLELTSKLKSITKIKEDYDKSYNELEKKYREALERIEKDTLLVEDLKAEHLYLQKEHEDVSLKLADLQHEAVNMEANQDAFKKFLDKLSMELQEKLGEDHVSKDTESEDLQEQAQIIGRQIVAHLNPTRKLQDDYEAIKQDREDLEEEVRYLKFALNSRLEIKSMQQPAMQKCDCSKQKEILKSERDEAQNKLTALENEVNRLHQDKQQLLMSFLNLQASQRSREVSKSEVNSSTDDNVTDDEDETETEYDSEEYEKSQPDSLNDSSRKSSFSDIAWKQNQVSNCKENFTFDNSEDTAICFQEMSKKNERLELERAAMLDSLCKQVERNNTLVAELDDLKNKNQTKQKSRPSSLISHSDSLNSLVSDKCSQCASSGTEIRHYLSILEQLTEDKLRLEKLNSDLEYECGMSKAEVEKLNNKLCSLDTNSIQVDSEVELRKLKKDKELLVQKIQALEQENFILEDNFKKLRDDKADILDKLHQCEEDRFGFIRTLSLITEQRETLEKELLEAKEENKLIKRKLLKANF